MGLYNFYIVYDTVPCRPCLVCLVPVLSLSRHRKLIENSILLFIICSRSMMALSYRVVVLAWSAAFDMDLRIRLGPRVILYVSHSGHPYHLPPLQTANSNNQDTRNISRILIELARTPMRIEPNTFIHPNRRWWWMTRDGRVDFPDYVKPYSGAEYQYLGEGDASAMGSAGSFGSAGSAGSYTSAASSAGSSFGSFGSSSSFGSSGSSTGSARNSDTASTAGSCRSQLSSSCGSPPLKASKVLLTAPPSPTLSMW